LISYVTKFIKRRLELSNLDKRSILIFTATKDHCNAMSNSLTNLSLPYGTRIEVLTSHSDDNERNSFLTAFAGQSKGLVLGCATTAAAEGIDYYDLGLVIVAGGVFGGLLMVHQMFNRAGRGVQTGQSAEALFVFAPGYMQDHVLGEEQDVILNDRESLEPFQLADKEKVKKFVTIQGLDALFEYGECGGVSMERALNVTNTSPKCERCNLCLGDSWQYELPPDNGSKKERKTKKMKQLEIKNVTLNEMRESERIELKSAMKFLKTPLTTGRCLWCKNLSGMCFPNKCKGLTTLLDKKACYSCFNTGHEYRQIQDKYNVVKAIVDIEKKKIENAKLHDDVEFSKCCVILKDCKEYERFKPCSSCWLSHDGKDEVNSCRENQDLKIQTIPRAVVIVWNTPWLKCKLMESLSSEDRLRIEQSWKEYFRWIVYEGTFSLQNAYRLISFFSKNYDEFIARVGQ